MRLRSDIFVSALIRLAETQGAVAMLRRRGAAEAGAIFVKVDRLAGAAALAALVLALLLTGSSKPAGRTRRAPGPSRSRTRTTWPAEPSTR